MITVFAALAVCATCFSQVHTLEIQARIDGFTGCCDSLLVLVGAVPIAGVYDIIDGESVTVSIDTTLIEVTTGTRDSCYGWSAVGSPCIGLDTCNGEGNSYSFEMTENTVFIWNFKRQFIFEVSSTRPGYDSPSPDYGIHWFDKDDSITASVDHTSGGFTCIGYTGTGSVHTGFGNVWTGILEEPSSIQWIITVEHSPCSLLVISEHGVCVPPAGYWHYILRGSTITAFVSVVDTSDIFWGIIYNCIGWIGTGCVPAFGPDPYVPPYNICAITMSSSGTIEWLWDTVYLNINETKDLPNSVEIYPFPNPFNSAVRIRMQNSECRIQNVEIFDIAGRRIDVIARSKTTKQSRSNDGEIAAGLRPRNDGGIEFIWTPESTLPSGIYLIRAKIGDGKIAEKRIVYLK